ncbi:MAG TPA: hypothetical protein VF170_04980 [Planctomycetaceae bacterium]
MATETVRITPQTYAVLKDLSERSGEPMTAVLQQAVEAYRRQKFLEDFAADFAALRSDEKAWEAEQAERAAWDAALADDLEGE